MTAMVEKKVKPVLPIYIAGVVFAGYGALFPLYRIGDIVIAGGIAVFFYILLSKIIPARTVYYEPAYEPPDTGNPEIDRMIEKGRKEMNQLAALAADLSHTPVARTAEGLAVYGEKILRFIEGEPGKAGSARSFLEYYLPATIKLLDSYREFKSQTLQGENANKAIQRVESAVETALAAFEKQLDSLYEDKTLDIVADARVLEEVLQRAGLAGGEHILQNHPKQ